MINTKSAPNEANTPAKIFLA